MRLIAEYATEGAPLLVADVATADAWRGREADGDVSVDWTSHVQDQLPPRFATKRPFGPQRKTFATRAEAEAFAEELTAAVREVMPEAKPWPNAPNQFYTGKARVFAWNLAYESACDRVASALKTPAKLLPVGGKSKALFLRQDGGGRGFVAIDDEDEASVVLVVARLHGSAPPVEPALRALGRAKPPAAAGKLAVKGPVVVFDAASSAADIAARNWKRPTLVAATPALVEAGRGPIRVSGQTMACAAFACLPPGTYAFATATVAKVGPEGATVWWLRRVK